MTDDYSQALLRAIATRSRVKILQGSFVSAATSGCTVDIGGNRIPAQLGTAFLPEVSELVWVWNIDKLFFVMGPAATKPDRGTVVSVAAGLVTLTSNLNTTVIAPYAGATPSAGQSMKLLWHGGPFAMLMSTSPAPVTAPPVGASGAATHVDPFTAVDSGSYGSGRWWTNQVYASDSNLGAWFYGTKIADTIPSSATIQKVEIYVGQATQISGAAPVFATHPYTSKPGGSPTLSPVAAVGIAPGWVDLGGAGISIGNVLRNSGGSFGVGVDHGGYNIFPSLAQDGQSGALRITSVY